MDKFKTVGELKEYLSSLPDETKLCSFMSDYYEYIGVIYTDIVEVSHTSTECGTDYYRVLENTDEPTLRVLKIGY